MTRIVDDLKDEQEQYRKMVMETIEHVCFILIIICLIFVFVIRNIRLIEKKNII